MKKYDHVFRPGADSYRLGGAGWNEGYGAGKRAGMALAASIAERLAGDNGMIVFSGQKVPDALMLHVRNEILAELLRMRQREELSDG